MWPTETPGHSYAVPASRFELIERLRVTRVFVAQALHPASRVVPGGIRQQHCLCICSIGHSDTSVSEYCRASARIAAVAEALTGSRLCRP